MGYTGGKVVDPSYKQVCAGTTDHAEAVRIEFDPTIVSYNELVGEQNQRLTYIWCVKESLMCLSHAAEFFYRTHDPTTVNSQGPDIGSRMSCSLSNQPRISDPSSLQSTVLSSSRMAQISGRLQSV